MLAVTAERSVASFVVVAAAAAVAVETAADNAAVAAVPIAAASALAAVERKQVLAARSLPAADIAISTAESTGDEPATAVGPETGLGRMAVLAAWQHLTAAGRQPQAADVQQRAAWHQQALSKAASSAVQLLMAADV